MPHAQPDKLIVSNLARLKQKYGAAGAKQVTQAVQALVAADATRGIVSQWVDLSDAAAMSAYGGVAIPAASAGDPQLNKEAIDVVFTHGSVRPSYLLLLGSTDVIPHVPLDNPMAGDGDADLPSDLPYACDHSYSTDVQDFIAPARVVGRLPGVTNDTKPTYLVGLLKTATKYKNRPASDYNSFLGISAQVWKTSSGLSLDAIFGTHAALKISPTDGPNWTAAESKRLAHFVNCHGAPADPFFYGQKGASYPTAHSAAWMKGKLVEGTVMAAECCYGAELYDPALLAAQGQMGMCNTYLGSKAYAYLGSTNIAYGPADAIDLADLMCQYFLLQVLSGASAGRACLQARLDYVLGKGGLLTPADLKTLGQFNLMGDPSLTPVAAQPHGLTLASVAGPKAANIATTAVERHSRLSRRAGLVAKAAATTAYRLTAPSAGPPGGKAGLFGKLRKMAADFGVTAPDTLLSYIVGTPINVAAKGFALSAGVAGSAPRTVSVMLEKQPAPPKVPQLKLVRGVQAVEYEEGMDVRPFLSR